MSAKRMQEPVFAIPHRDSYIHERLFPLHATSRFISGTSPRKFPKSLPREFAHTWTLLSIIEVTSAGASTSGPLCYLYIYSSRPFRPFAEISWIRWADIRQLQKIVFGRKHLQLKYNLPTCHTINYYPGTILPVAMHMVSRHHWRVFIHMI